MAFAGLVDAGEDRIHNTEPRAASNAAARSALSRTHRPIGVGGGFECPDDARPNRDVSISPGSLANLGRLEEARSETKTGLALDPNFSVRRFGSGGQADERLLDAIRKAGVPEG